MKNLCVVISACFVFGAFASQPAVAGSAAPASEATKVRSLLLYQNGLFNQARWRPMWQTYTPRARSRCTYARFAATMKATRASVGRVATRNIVVRVSGRRAFVTYRMFAGSRLVGAATAKSPDLYARIGDRWFDDDDPGSIC